MTNTLQIADFNGITLQIIQHNGESWLKSEQIGIALGLKNPRKSVNRIYNSHADEFNQNMSTVTDLVTVQGARETRLFSPRGAWMIGMWSQTDRAKQFRQWILDVLDNVTQPKTLNFDVKHLHQEVLKANPHWVNIKRYKEMGLTMVEVGKLMDCHESTIRLSVRRMEKCGIMEPPTNLLTMQENARKSLPRRTSC